ncbi:ATP-binding protein [Methanobacterium alcaliphilum]|uniref:ATP-binding protein n=1 Tax=Methanobacterium alcaliphilum TaxID=392018 RepID=UPI00200A070D|nr:ATP-binding protein [Methanobacterium alcaliphilum]MCK9151530.1 ATP-binding protein [Methanobacterium alcaliphilum]
MGNLKTIVILSGKGGVGKSTLTASLSAMLSKNRKIMVADCDVDAPNLAMVLGLEDQQFNDWSYIKTSEKAHMVKETCKGRKKCVKACNFSAVKWDSKKSLPKFNELLCTGCGACIVVCPDNVIELKEIENGKIGSALTPYGFPIVTGQLNIGESGSGKVVDSVKDKAQKLSETTPSDLLIIDAAAGLGCPVIASVKGTDFVLIVTEPTPVAFSDLKRALGVVKYFNIDHGLVINRWDINEDFTRKIEKFARSNDIPLLGKIQYDKRFVDALVNLKPAVIYEDEFKKIFSNIIDKLDDSTDILDLKNQN